MTALSEMMEDVAKMGSAWKGETPADLMVRETPGKKVMNDE